MMKSTLWLLAIASLVLVGCGSTEATATPQEQAKFENPDKTPPPEAGGPPRAGRPTQVPGAPPQAAQGGPENK